MDLSLCLCEDAPSQIEYLSKLLTHWEGLRGHKLIIHAFPRAEQFWSFCEDGGNWDLLLLDIEMPGQNGMELAKKLRKRQFFCPIIFITGYSEFMAEGYDVEALHYLLKPVSEEVLFPVLDRAVQRLQKSSSSILLFLEGLPTRIPTESILYAEVLGHSIYLHTHQGTYETQGTISSLAAELGGAFCRCHRSYLVSLSKIRQIQKSDLLLTDGSTVPLSRRMAGAVTDAFFRFYRREAEQ